MSKGSSGEPTDKFDLDFWYNPTYVNYYNLLSALEIMGENVGSIRKEKSPNPLKSFFKFQYHDFTLDFLPSIGSPLKFRDSLKNCDLLSIQEIEIPFINIDDLILIKERHGREKDMEDIEQLKKIKKEEKI